MSRLHEKARLLMSAPVVGTIVSLTFACAIDDPSRFTSSKQVGPYLGLTPKKYQSGQTDCTGRISRHGDVSAREALYEAAHLMLTKPIKGCSELKSWATRIARIRLRYSDQLPESQGLAVGGGNCGLKSTSTLSQVHSAHSLGAVAGLSWLSLKTGPFQPGGGPFTVF